VDKLGNIDAFARSRRAIAPADDRRAAGYRRLCELCALGEVAAAKRLCDRHPEWGYAISGSEVAGGDAIAREAL